MNKEDDEYLRTHCFSGYSKGAFNALLNLKDFLETHSDGIKYFLKSRKQYENFILSFLDILLKNSVNLDKFLENPFDFSVQIDAKNDKGKVIKVTNDR